MYCFNFKEIRCRNGDTIFSLFLPFFLANDPSGISSDNTTYDPNILKVSNLSSCLYLCYLFYKVLDLRSVYFLLFINCPNDWESFWYHYISHRHWYRSIVSLNFFLFWLLNLDLNDCIGHLFMIWCLSKLEVGHND